MRIYLENLFRKFQKNVQMFLRIRERCFACVRNKILLLQKWEIVVHLFLGALVFVFWACGFCYSHGILEISL